MTNVTWRLLIWSGIVDEWAFRFFRFERNNDQILRVLTKVLDVETFFFALEDSSEPSTGRRRR
jgi:hypothetical protein